MNNYSFISGARDVAGTVAVVCRYYLLISWRVRRQLRRWHRRAERIADPELRATALEKLRGESLHAQAAAVFATTAPCRRYGPLTELQVGIAVMFDFLDGVSEAAVPDQIANGRHLYRALTAALDPGAEPADYYAAYTLGEGDGGYLDDLAAACRSALGRLPSADVVRPLALEAAMRCGVGQTRTHSAQTRGIDQLRAWAETLQPPGRDYAWWELGAGGAASLALHALLAAAADPATTSAHARRLDAAYFPSVCALATLLDSLIDYDGDQTTGAHSFVSYYGKPEVAAERLAGIAADGVEAVAGIRRRSRQHVVIATGVVAFYLSAASAHGVFAGMATRRVIGAMNPFVLRPILAIATAKRRL
jgi:tetraprenyl-beta-curcumene synthase